jgi:hypothetical protein
MIVQTTNRWRVIAGAVMIGGLVFAATSSSVYAQARGLDHFKCYGLLIPVQLDPPPPPEVLIADQFSEERVVIGDEYRFCNPVEKRFHSRISPIIDNDHHLTFYHFDPVTPQQIAGVVSVVNQFGRQKFEFESANVLAVPTEKQEPGLSPPVGLNHFKCYFIAGALPRNVIAVGLEDQFEKAKHKVLAPFLFCNPAEKEDVAGNVTPIEDPNAHLTCYKISLVNFFANKSIVIANQFTDPSTKDLFPFRADLLCLPSRKEGFRLL